MSCAALRPLLVVRTFGVDAFGVVHVVEKKTVLTPQRLDMKLE